MAESVQSTLEGSILLDDEVRSCPDCPEPKPVSDSIGIHDTINYVYTSGTTGMPKACLLSHLRLDTKNLSKSLPYVDMATSHIIVRAVFIHEKNYLDKLFALVTSRLDVAGRQEKGQFE